MDSYITTEKAMPLEMIIIDTHTHLFADDFNQDIDSVVSRAMNLGVQKALLPNIDENSIEELKNTLKKFPDFFRPMMGLHPTSITNDWLKQLSIIHDELNSDNYVGIGEIGLDLYWDKSTLEVQKNVFEQQLEWSIEKKLPVSIHSREAIKEVIESIKRINNKNLYGVFHSFGGNSNELAEILTLSNFYIGINGVVTFKNSGLDKVISSCPLDRIVLETDSPWLAPIPHRGKRNETSYIVEIIKKLSGIYNIHENEIAEITTYNARKLFNL